MSRMSALTTFRLIGSPTNPVWPYWRPCPGCCDMLSLAGDVLTGVGEASGSAIRKTDDVRADLAVLAEPASANVKPLRDKPLAHASANVLIATFFKCLGIVPSSGMFSSELPATRSLEML